jgi:hypothetical protein
MKKKILKILRPIHDYLYIRPLLAYIPYHLLEYYFALVSKKYQNIPFETTAHLNCDNKKINDSIRLDIVTVAFNNASLIESQIDLLQKNLTDKFFFTVADNSNNIQASKAIQCACATKKIGYIKLPKNPWRQANLSHSVTLNWLFYNFIKPRQAEYFGFIDHDIFPIKNTSILNRFSSEKIMYGQMIEKKGKYLTPWYLWAGFCFFKFQNICNKKLNFSAILHISLKEIIGLDTGGANWIPLYSQVDKSKVSIANVLSDDNFVRVDSWAHLEKASFKTTQEIKTFLEKLNNKIL